MTLSQVLYLLLVVLGLVDIALVTPALRAATRQQTAGRLVSTLLVLTGLVVGASARVAQHPHLNLTLTVSLVVIDLGLVGYTLTLPDTGLLALLRRHGIGARKEAGSDQ